MKKITRFILASCILSITSSSTTKKYNINLLSNPILNDTLSLNISKIDSLMFDAKANGVLLKDGKLVKEWSYDKPISTKIETQSITKSIVSLLLGIALDEKKIKNIDEEVYKYYPSFDVGPYTKKITFRHLVTISSGIAAMKFKENYGDPNNMAPGIDARYHNDHFHQLAYALTYIFEKPLIDVLNEKILTHLSASVEWKVDGEVELINGNKIKVNGGYAYLKINAHDLAKVGLLYLNKGIWEKKRLLSESYINQTLSPINVPLMISRPNQEVKIDVNNTYGLGWRGIKLTDNKILWHMSGNGGQFCAIIPDKKMVFVKINGYTNEYKPYKGLSNFKHLLFSPLLH